MKLTYCQIKESSFVMTRYFVLDWIGGGVGDDLELDVFGYLNLLDPLKFILDPFYVIWN